MDQISCPAWYGGLKLKADDFIGLENFLLSRAAFSERVCHGIEALDTGISVSGTLNSGQLALSVAEVAGLTPSGRPVVLRGATVLKTVLELPAGADSCLDLWIKVQNPGSDSHPEGEERLGKLALLAEVVEASASPAALRNDCLYLGRYSSFHRQVPQLINRPLVRRFSAMRPVDRVWLDPLQQKIKALLQSVTLATQAIGEIAYGVRVVNLALEWGDLPLVDLVRQGKLVARLSAYRPRLKPEAVDEGLSVPLWTPADASGDSLPAKIANEFELPATKADGRRLERRTDYDAAADGPDLKVVFKTEVRGSLELRLPRGTADAPSELGVYAFEGAIERRLSKDDRGNFAVYTVNIRQPRTGECRFRAAASYVDSHELWLRG